MEPAKQTFPAKKGRVNLPPDKYDPAYLLAQYHSCDRSEFQFHRRVNGTKIYVRKNLFWCVAFRNKVPPEHFYWAYSATIKSRNIYWSPMAV